MNPVLDVFGGWRIPMYGLCVGMGYVVVFHLCMMHCRDIGLDRWNLLDVLFVSFLASVIGSHALKYFLPAHLSSQRMSFGSITLAAAVCIVYTRMLGMPVF